MMKKFIFFFHFLGSVLLMSSAFAGGVEPVKQGLYYGIHIGVSAPEGPGSRFLEAGYDGGLQLGYQLRHFRFESELNYFNNYETVRTAVQLNYAGLMFNTLYNFSLQTKIMPFIGVGLGYYGYWLNLTSTRVPFSTSLVSQFAYQGLAGFSFNYDEHWTVALRYHYLTWASANGFNAQIVDLVFNYYHNV